MPPKPKPRPRPRLNHIIQAGLVEPHLLAEFKKGFNPAQKLSLTQQKARVTQMREAFHLTNSGIPGKKGLHPLTARRMLMTPAVDRIRHGFSTEELKQVHLTHEKSVRSFVVESMKSYQSVVNEKKADPLIFKAIKSTESSAARVQLGLAFEKNGHHFVTVEQYISAGEQVPHGLGKTLTARHFKAYFENRSQRPVSRIPHSWNVTKDGGYHTTLFLTSSQKKPIEVWVEFRLNEKNQIHEPTINFGLMEKGKPTESFYVEIEDWARQEIIQQLTRQLMRPRKKKEN